MAKGLTLKVKTASQPVYVKNYENGDKLSKGFMEQLEETCATTVVKAVQREAMMAKIMSWRIVATFFQRVVARTPIDEDYWVKYQNNKTRNYKRDNNSCKLDWFLQYGSKKIYVYQIIDDIGNVFADYNDRPSILTLENYISNIFKGTKTGKVTATIGNDNPHFAVLEYGGIRGKPNKEIKNPHNPPDELQEEEGLKHRLKNGRSIQAPYGMLRITEAELETIIREAKNDNYDLSFMKKIGKSRNPQKRTINKLMKTLAGSGKFSIDELEDLM